MAASNLSVMLLMIIFGFIAAVYLGLLIAFIYGWNKVSEFKLKGRTSENTFSIVIPFRNESLNLPHLFKSLSSLNFPTSNFEILLVNDASEDNSKAMAESFQKDFPEFEIKVVENFRKTNSPKKDAINRAIEISKFDYILTTDADCRVPANWLHYFDEVIQSDHPKMIAGPVGFIQTADEKPYFQNFEELDFLSLQSSTIGSFGIEKAIMCNAANLCYEKEAFLGEAGFNDDSEIASGDDVFLLQNFRKKGLKVLFLKSEKATVFTNYQKSPADLINQRVRWAAKTSSYPSNFAKFTGIVVLMMNLSMIIFTLAVFLDLFPFQFLLFVFLLKFNLDFFLIYKSAKFMNREVVLRSYLWSSIAYPFFSVYVASLSLLNGYEWKGRKFKK